jgi:hypothetical protein
LASDPGPELGHVAVVLLPDLGGREGGRVEVWMRGEVVDSVNLFTFPFFHFLSQ